MSIISFNMLLKEPWYSGVARMVTIRVPLVSLIITSCVRVVEPALQDTRYGQPLVGGGNQWIERHGSRCRQV